MLNAVGIDVSKGKSPVAVLRHAGEVVRKPFDVKHTPLSYNVRISLLFAGVRSRYEHV